MLAVSAVSRSRDRIHWIRWGRGDLDLEDAGFPIHHQSRNIEWVSGGGNWNGHHFGNQALLRRFGTSVSCEFWEQFAADIHFLHTDWGQCSGYVAPNIMLDRQVHTNVPVEMNAVLIPINDWQPDRSDAHLNLIHHDVDRLSNWRHQTIG